MHQTARVRVIASGAACAAAKSRATSVTARWLLGGLLLIAFGVVLAFFSPRFGYAYELGEMPIIWLTAGLVLAGPDGTVLSASHPAAGQTPWKS